MLASAGGLKLLFPRLDQFRLSFNDSEPTSANPLWQHLAVLDHLRTKGRELSDPLLLATLTTAPVLALMETLPPGHDVGKSLHQYLEENFKPLAIPRIVRTHVHLLHLALRHMLAPKKKKRRRSLRRSPLFADALKLLEIHCLATEQHRSALHRWQRSPMKRGGLRTKRLGSF